MNNATKGLGTDLRSLLKHQHKKVYSVCRLFALTYKEHQRLFTDIIAAASQNIRACTASVSKETLLLRACINMAALHSIAQGIEPDPARAVEFKSPDFQRSMTALHSAIGTASDYEKFRLFMEFEQVAPDQYADLTGLSASQRLKKKDQEIPKKNFIPYLKQKLVWS